ncbi:hypothetical protein J2W40_002204 [Sphingobium xenophagum]|uniref:Uncharacterized protein n=1 Tax=Sphingobium xenophagum TaxID=121428 RepID=A0ABU1X2H9_SPHXE|nr:hypothetical protein [Sphingobium xenophagum]
MEKFIYGSILGDLKAADEMLAVGVKRGDREMQQRACLFAMAAIQRNLPVGIESAALIRASMALARTADGRVDDLFVVSKGGRGRATPERQLDAYAILFVRIFTGAGLGKGAAYKRVATLLGRAGMTTHGGGRQADTDHHAGRAPTPGSIRSLWEASRHGGRLAPLGERADELLRDLVTRGFHFETVADVEKFIGEMASKEPLSVVDLLTTPPRSEPIE